MKKKFKLKVLSILMAVLMIATIIPMGAISSFAFTSGDYEYRVVSETYNTAEITKYNGTDGDVTIPSKIDSYIISGIGYEAFRDCTGLKSVTIPYCISFIYYSAFDGCTNLTAINVSEDNTKYSSVDGILYRDKTTLLIYPQGKSGEVTVPTGVTSIGTSAFEGYSAFEGCTGLKGVTIPNSVTSIGDSAFNGCTGLTSVTIPNSVTSIGDSAFRGCTGLTVIN
ncbi:MAG: leucine-rich repeat domain-containing protein, partial [Oscillospiraceae bacterium]